mmetsp:Transcript_2/g.6  ORF Transcript_2/g.6 Transcript_2/m.6 type:complete len:101 (-) Transcript_2:756-1058(-)
MSCGNMEIPSLCKSRKWETLSRIKKQLTAILTELVGCFLVPFHLKIVSAWGTTKLAHDVPKWPKWCRHPVPSLPSLLEKGAGEFLPPLLTFLRIQRLAIQ